MNKKVELFFANVEALITQNRINECKAMLNSPLLYEYEKYYSISSTINYIENDYLKAIEVLRVGLSKFPYSTDLLYNTAIVFKALNMKEWDNIPIQLSEFKYSYDILLGCDNDAHFRKEELTLIGDDYFKMFIIRTLPWIEKKYVVNYVNINACKQSDLFQKMLNSSGCILEDTSSAYKDLDLEPLINQIRNSNMFLVFKSELTPKLPFEGFKYKVRRSLTKAKAEVLVLGLSYAEVGIIESQFQNGCINMALSSQDLFYDSKILDLFLKNKLFNIKKVILNLSYYSFRFDLSKTFERVRIRRYLPLINDTNNYKNHDLLSVLNFAYDDCQEESQYSILHQKKSGMKFNLSLASKGKKYAEYHSKIGSKQIETENIKIFSQIIKTLNNNGIEPYILICPVTKYYYEHFDLDLKERFYKIINSTEVNFSSDIIDLFNSDLFYETDFWDDSHLNHEGALKLSNLVASKLNI